MSRNTRKLPDRYVTAELFEFHPLSGFHRSIARISEKSPQTGRLTPVPLLLNSRDPATRYVELDATGCIRGGRWLDMMKTLSLELGCLRGKGHWHPDHSPWNLIVWRIFLVHKSGTIPNHLTLKY